MLVPAVIWLYMSDRPLPGTIMLVFSILAVTVDNIIRPLFIKKGAHLPLVMVIAGVIGGLLAFGIVGLFGMAGTASADPSFDEGTVSMLDEVTADLSFALGSMEQEGRRRQAEQELRNLNADLEQRVGHAVTFMPSPCADRRRRAPPRR